MITHTIYQWGQILSEAAFDILPLLVYILVRFFVSSKFNVITYALQCLVEFKDDFLKTLKLL